MDGGGALGNKGGGGRGVIEVEEADFDRNKVRVGLSSEWFTGEL